MSGPKDHAADAMRYALQTVSSPVAANNGWKNLQTSRRFQAVANPAEAGRERNDAITTYLREALKDDLSRRDECDIALQAELLDEAAFGARKFRLSLYMPPAVLLIAPRHLDPYEATRRAGTDLVMDNPMSRLPELRYRTEIPLSDREVREATDERVALNATLDALAVRARSGVKVLRVTRWLHEALPMHLVPVVKRAWVAAEGRMPALFVETPKHMRPLKFVLRWDDVTPECTAMERLPPHVATTLAMEAL